MSRPRFFAVKNFKVHQHYKDRRPPWIKLHVSLLDDYDFTRLQDASRSHLTSIWILASKLENRIPFDAEWVRSQITASSPVDLNAFLDLGLIEMLQDDSAPLAERVQPAMVETEAEEESETDLLLQQREPKIAATGSATALPEEAVEFPTPDFELYWMSKLQLSPSYREDFKQFVFLVPNPVAWLAECSAALEGMHGPIVTPVQLGRAIRDYVAAGVQTHTLIYFRKFLARARQEDEPKSEPLSAFRPNKWKAEDNVRGEAMMILGNLRAKRESAYSPNGGGGFQIPRPLIDAMDPVARTTLIAVGGPRKLANCEDKEFGFLLGQFATAYKAALSMQAEKRGQQQ